MARQFCDDGTEIYRVAVTSKKDMGINPDYDWRTARETGELSRIYSETETETEHYGPYKSASTAKAQVAFRSHHYTGGHDAFVVPYPWVIEAHVEKANIVWEIVP